LIIITITITILQYYNYYNNYNCLATASIDIIPRKYIGPANVHSVPGWNDIVEEKHHLAGEAFLEWSYVGRPRQGPEFLLMKKTRASFKLALRYCKQHEEAIKAYHCAASLSTKDYSKFWNSIRKMNNSSTTTYVNSIGGAVGEANIANTWRTHFSELYNSVADDVAQAKFYEKVKACTENNSGINVCVQDVVNAVGKQKKVKQQDQMTLLWKLLHLVVISYVYIFVCCLISLSSLNTYLHHLCNQLSFL